MIAIARQLKVNPRGWRQRYLRLLPSIRRHAEQAFRHWDEEQRIERGNHEAADHGSAQWSVLLTACTQPEAHREHAQ